MINDNSVDGDKPLLPSNDDWDERIAEILRGEEVDTDLGRRMARDALRVARGELSDEAFNDRYRDEVMSVFGTCDWPPDTVNRNSDPDTGNRSSK
jgi:hypothetical protein